MFKWKQLRHKNILMMSFKLNFGQKCSDIGKWLFETSILVTFYYLSEFMFSEVIGKAIWLKVKLT